MSELLMTQEEYDDRCKRLNEQRIQPCNCAAGAWNYDLREADYDTDYIVLTEDEDIYKGQFRDRAHRLVGGDPVKRRWFQSRADKRLHGRDEFRNVPNVVAFAILNPPTEKEHGHE